MVKGNKPVFRQNGSGDCEGVGERFGWTVHIPELHTGTEVTKITCLLMKDKFSRKSVEHTVGKEVADSGREGKETGTRKVARTRGKGEGVWGA